LKPASRGPATPFARLRARARELKIQVHALLLAYRDPRTPWYAKALAALVAAYALSPIDLIPDFIPVLGQLDDLLLVPLGIALAVRLIPREVLADCRARAREADARPPIRPWLTALLVAGLWLVLLVLVAWLVLRPLLRYTAG
jgi:uncharacterized membrane protein YkvA (DUF1232 family)